jgi:hypothetical protein
MLAGENDCSYGHMNYFEGKFFFFLYLYIWFNSPKVRRGEWRKQRERERRGNPLSINLFCGVVVTRRWDVRCNLRGWSSLIDGADRVNLCLDDFFLKVFSVFSKHFDLSIGGLKGQDRNGKGKKV